MIIKIIILLCPLLLIVYYTVFKIVLRTIFSSEQLDYRSHYPEAHSQSWQKGKSTKAIV